MTSDYTLSLLSDVMDLDQRTRRLMHEATFHMEHSARTAQESMLYSERSETPDTPPPAGAGPRDSTYA